MTKREKTGTDMMSLSEIQAKGMKALSKALGPVGMVRFLQQYETGYGNYAAERRRLLGDATIDEIVQQLEQRRATGEETQP